MLQSIYILMRQPKDLDSIKKEDAPKKCPDCGSVDLDNRGGEIFCKKCGLVID